jgi:hypothetical protein
MGLPWFDYNSVGGNPGSIAHAKMGMEPRVLPMEAVKAKAA